MAEITEKILLDHYTGISNGLDKISDLPGGIRIWWNYRRGNWGDGFNPVVPFRCDAAEISLENDRRGIIPLNPDCENHPAQAKIESDFNRAVGDEI